MGNYKNSIENNIPLIRKRVSTDLFLVLEMREEGKGVDFSKCKNVKICVVNEDGITSKCWKENVTTKGSRLAIQMNATDNNITGIFRVSVIYDIPSDDSETGFIHVVRDIPNAFEIIPLSTEETQAMVFVVSSQGGLKPTDAKDGKDGRFKRVVHESTDTTCTLTPNVRHVWGEVERLDLSLEEDNTSDYVNEYSFIFRCMPNAPTALNLPNNLEWAERKVVKLEAGKRYEGSIIDNAIVLLEI
nr:MAG TPA: hypothetical protein [Caudoviricetes sp.]